MKKNLCFRSNILIFQFYELKSQKIHSNQAKNTKEKKKERKKKYQVSGFELWI